MANVLFELDRLKVNLENKGLDSDTIDGIIKNASGEIQRAFAEQGSSAMQLAIEQGVVNRAPDFINELLLDAASMEITTLTGNMDFSEPPRPMLPYLLKNAKPLKDGSGVYKVVPVGEPGKNRPTISSSIYDVWKQQNAEQIEAANAQKSKIAPKGSKSKFRTATSKQSATTQWVIPAKEKNFSESVANINSELGQTMEDIVRRIVQEYTENF